MAAFTLTVAGTDLSTLGFKVLDPGGLWDPIPRRTEILARVDAVESLVVTDVAQVEPTRVLLRAAVIAADLATLDANLDKLKFILRAETMVLEMSDRAREKTVVRVGQAEIGRLLRAEVRIAREFVIPLEAPDPRWYDKSASNIALSTTEAVVAIGTAETEPIITGLPGTCTIEHRDSASAVIETFGFTGIASTPVTVNFKLKTVVDNGGTGRPNAIDAGAVFFSLGRPASSYDFLTSAWPRLRLTTGTGSAAVTKAWE